MITKWFKINDVWHCLSVNGNKTYLDGKLIPEMPGNVN
jgi:hypothetical protein